MTSAKRNIWQAVVALLCLSVLAVDAHASPLQNPQQWKRYRVNDEEFSIILPEAPAMMTSHQSLEENRTRRIRHLGAYMDGVVYTIVCYQNVKHQSIDDLLNVFTKPRSYTQKPTIRTMTRNGFEGRELVSKSETGTSIEQYWKTKENLYVVGMLSRGDVSTSKNFFDSLTLAGTPSGEEVNDGIGPAENDSATDESSQVFTGKQVDLKPRLGTKPEPSYTEEARQKGVTGTVFLKAVFSANGRVTNIDVKSGLPYGLTERAIGAVRQIKFIPAQKEGKNVSMWMAFEFNFNLD